MKHLLRRIPAYWFVIGVAFIAVAPLWQSGFLNTKAAGETPYLLARVQQMAASLKDGVFPVRWMPDGAYGLGYPFFNFYAALPYYIASFLHVLGFSIVISLKITHTIGFMTGALGMYYWMRRHLRTESAAVLAAAVFTFAPMHMVNMYIRGDSLSEFWAMGLFPVVLWAIDRVIARPCPGSIALLGIAGAGVVLSHNISAMIFLPLSAIYGLWMLWPKFDWWRFSALAVGGLLAVLLSVWFWLPALAERDTVQTDGRMTEGYFYWGNNFLDGDLFETDWAVDYASFPPGLGVWQGVLVTAGVVSAIIWIRRKKSPSRLIVWALLVFGMSLALTQSFSSPAYETIGVLAYLQFTWRWLILTAISAAAVAAYSVEGVNSSQLRRIVTSVLVVITAIGGLIRLDLDFMPISDADITVERLAEREFYAGDIGTTVTTEYLPVGMSPRIYSGPIIVGHRNLKVLDGDVAGELVARESTSEQWRINVTSEHATIAIPTLYWPGWWAELDDGTKLDVRPVEGIMWLGLAVPQGTYTLTLELHSTPTQLTANVLSFLGVLIVGVMIGQSVSFSKMRRKSAIFGVGGVGSILVVLLMLPDHSPQGPQATQFWRNSYRNAYVDGLVFSDEARLINYQYPTEIKPGETLTVFFEWEENTTATVELVPPLVNLWNLDVALAVGSGEHEILLDIPSDAAPGVYFVRLIHNGEIYDLTPVRILEGESAAVTEAIADFGDELRLNGVRADSLTNGRLNIHLNWQVLQPITENYSLALRLHNPYGHQIAAYDGPMGAYGGYPPAYWDTYFTDWVTLNGLNQLPPGEGYRLMVTVYTLNGALGNVMFHDLMIQDSPEQKDRVVAELQGEVTLQDEQIEQGASLSVWCKWLGVVEAEWRVQWVFDDVHSVITPLAPGARLDWWRADQRYRAIVFVPIPLELEPGMYSLQWRIIDGDDEAITELQAAGEVEILATTRTFMPPDAQLLAIFDSIQLLDYALELDGDMLNVEFSWGLTEPMQSNYTLFVHVIDPVDGRVVAQTDTMPRSGMYPVTAWLVGELVEDTVEIDVSGVESGEYQIAMGWYDPLDPAKRVSVVDADDNSVPDGRLELPTRITIP